MGVNKVDDMDRPSPDALRDTHRFLLHELDTRLRPRGIDIYNLPLSWLYALEQKLLGAKESLEDLSHEFEEANS